MNAKTVTTLSRAAGNLLILLTVLAGVFIYYHNDICKHK